MLIHNPIFTGSISLNGTDISQVSTVSTDSSSFALRITNNESTSSAFVIASGSFSNRITNTESTASAFISASGSFSTRTTAVEATASQYVTASGSLAARLTSNESKTGSFATTGSNFFIGNQVITGSVYIANDLIVQGSSSLQNITASAVSVGTNTIILNTATPILQFGGISVFDSGSTMGRSGSLLWNSINDHWINVNPSGSDEGYNSAMIINGPKNTGSLGSEAGLTTNYIPVSQGEDHITDSIIFQSGSTNIGIGTTSPEGKLTIKGTSAQPLTSGTTANSLLQLVGSLGAEINIGSNTVTGGYGSYIQVSDNNLAVPYQLNLQPNGGNVLIGTNTDAGFRLDVNGTGIYRNSSDSRLIIYETGTDPYTATLELASQAIGTYGAIIQYTSNAENLTIQNYGRSASGLSRGDIKFRTKVSNTTPTDVLSLNGFTGAATFSNKIGVGGASATYSLTAYNSANGTTAAFGGTVYGIRIDNGGTFSSGRSTIFGVDTSFYGSYQPLSIEASSLALNAITGGNVGIGTASPATKLHVLENGLFTNGGTDSGQSYVPSQPILTVTTDGNGTASSVYATNAVFKVGIGGGSTGNVTTEWFRVNLNGNIGIGVTNPTGQLSIKNQISNGNDPISSYAATNGVNGQNFFNGYYVLNSDGFGQYPRYLDIVSTGSPDGSNGGSNIRFFTNPITNSSPAVERMRIRSNGEVNISNSILRLNAATTTSVSTSATTISTGGNTYGGLAIVWGNDVSGNIWTDLLFYSLGQVFVIRSQDVSGGPFGRTYSVNGSGALRLAMAGGTYTVRFQALLTS
jgi:hypothetical protein